ncbi:MAG TPA: DUF1810 domain-containing protein [Bryobacteraceae bacterium]|nr:DUF1810 domain-containing protein [Bryobacteraceae bacterium]
MNDPFNLERFVTAQNPVFEAVRAELQRGCKQGHWMWFIFPQLRGLGHSAMATRFGIASRAEAEAYIAHPILGPRLMECTELVNLVEGHTAKEIFGAVDALKFRSSMTLFAATAGDAAIFANALQKYFSGQPDRLTLERLVL